MGGGWFCVGHYFAKRMLQILFFRIQDCVEYGKTHSKNGQEWMNLPIKWKIPPWNTRAQSWNRITLPLWDGKLRFKTWPWNTIQKFLQLFSANIRNDGTQQKENNMKKTWKKWRAVLLYTRLVAFMLIEPHSLMGQQGPTRLLIGNVIIWELQFATLGPNY